MAITSKPAVNLAGGPIKSGDGLIVQARMLVAAYNRQAAELAKTVEGIFSLREQMNDAVGAGVVMVSGDGWQEEVWSLIHSSALRAMCIL